MSVDTILRGLEKTLAQDPEDEDAQEALRQFREKARTFLPEDTPDLWDGEGHKAKPMVGMAVSFGAGSDSYPGTIVKVSKTGHSVTVRYDSVERVSGSFRSNDWKGRYYEPDGCEAATAVYTRRRKKECASCRYEHPLDVGRCTKQLSCQYEWVDGPRGSGTQRKVARAPKWRPIYRLKGATGRGCGYLSIGHRRYYQDPSF